MKLPREIGWMRLKCERLSDMTNILHAFMFDGYTINFMTLGKNPKIICSGTFENFRDFQMEIWKYYDALSKYYYTKGCVEKLRQPLEKFIYMGNYKRKTS